LYSWVKQAKKSSFFSAGTFSALEKVEADQSHPHLSLFCFRVFFIKKTRKQNKDRCGCPLPGHPLGHRTAST
jgi:hypothetical protein